MARRSKRLTRKDIRRPDQFFTFAATLLDFSSKHKTSLLALSLLLVATLSGFWLWEFYKTGQNRLASEQYSRALDLYHTGKYHDALAALKTVATYRSSNYARFAQIQLANAHIALNELPQAVNVLKGFLAGKNREPFLKQAALVALGHAHELSGNCKEAVNNFIAAEKTPGPLKEEAVLAGARCSAANGDPKEALVAYRRYLAEFPGSDRVSEILIRAQELEGRIRSQS